ncbi:hypothetical protein K450DRAFT_251469 [Umbelopsis ramanniana AG]|uniref:Uncharacterized protein n=1 Tax=Umbelopsis ramanniana AG TaxID=1314678 RepID=A0AAD5E6C7_UMBRA|nr:uncharacterized protein K450DRAFT_251469 [Umbelopsis ramanniana AG]KAI8577572.1 hypothetical protein K450DRAFT_251469 [Umbelopsis ramanniana AG]
MVTVFIICFCLCVVSECSVGFFVRLVFLVFFRYILLGSSRLALCQQWPVVPDGEIGRDFRFCIGELAFKLRSRYRLLGLHCLG